MSQVLFQCHEELLELSLVKIELCLTQRVDQVTDAGAHDLATFTSVQSLFLDLRDESLDAVQDLCAFRHALCDRVLGRDGIVHLGKLLLVVRLFFDDVALFQ